MVTLVLAVVLQVAPSIDRVPHQPRERAGTFKRSLAMTGTSFGSILTTATLGGAAGFFITGSFARGSDMGTAALFGLGLGAMVGVALSPILSWAVGRALGGEGTLTATILGTVAGVALFALAFGIAVASVPASGWFPANLIPLAVTAPAVIVSGPWAFEISDSAAIYVSPTSFSMTF